MDASRLDAAGGLVAVLLNPVPHGRLTTSVANVRVAAAVLGFDTFKISNLNSTATVDYPTLVRTAAVDTWDKIRPALRADLEQAETLLFAWGVSATTSPCRDLRKQIAWVLATADEIGHRSAFMVDGQPRHPSRWRQYLGPLHGRHSAGATFAARLGLALRPVALQGVGPCQ